MPEGDSILLLHGFTNTHRAWGRLRRAGVQERFEEVLAPDIRGHGAAADVRPVALGPVLDDIDLLLARPTTVLGYSQGGRIALHAALDPVIAPRVAHLVLIGASPGLADPAERAARRAADEALATEIESAPIETFAACWAQTSVLAGLPDALAREAHEDRLHNDPAGLAAALRGLGTGALPSLWDTLRRRRLTMPVTLIAGERDAKFTALAHEMAALIPSARVAIVPGAGHQVHLETPAAVAELL